MIFEAVCFCVLSGLASAVDQWQGNILDDFFRGRGGKHSGRWLRDPLLRPGRPGVPLNVSLRLVVHDATFDEDRGVMDLKLWQVLLWREDSEGSGDVPRLRWEPALFGGLRSVPVPPRHIWLPDLTLLGTLEGERPLSALSELPSPDVHHDGRVRWTVPQRVRVLCAARCAVPSSTTDYSRRFPPDEPREGLRKCHLDYALWNSAASQVSLTLAGRPSIAFADRWRGRRWEGVSSESFGETLENDSQQSSARLRFHVALRRRSGELGCSSVSKANKGSKEANWTSVCASLATLFIASRIASHLHILPFF